MRYGNQTVIHNDTEDAPAPLENTPPDCSMPKQGSESSAKYSKDSDPHCDLAELQEHFQQLQEQLTLLEPTTNPHTNAEELAQLTNKLQQLTITLQQHPVPRPVEETLHLAMQKYTGTL